MEEPAFAGLPPRRRRPHRRTSFGGEWRFASAQASTMAPRSPRRRRACEPRQASYFSGGHNAHDRRRAGGGRGSAARDRPADRASDRAGGIVTPQGAETPRPLPAGGSVALIKRDRARPPEDEKVRGRARPALARSNVRGRLDNSASRGSAFILPGKGKRAFRDLEMSRWATPPSLVSTSGGAHPIVAIAALVYMDPAR